MSKKRKPAPPRVTGRTSDPIDFKGRPPMICTLGADLEESRRFQVQLEVLKGRACLLSDKPLTT